MVNVFSIRYLSVPVPRGRPPNKQTPCDQPPASRDLGFAPLAQILQPLGRLPSAQAFSFLPDNSVPSSIVYHAHHPPMLGVLLTHLRYMHLRRWCSVPFSQGRHLCCFPPYIKNVVPLWRLSLFPIGAFPLRCLLRPCLPISPPSWAIATTHLLCLSPSFCFYTNAGSIGPLGSCSSGRWPSFNAYSQCRGAASSAFSSGASLLDILCSAEWSQESIFRIFYFSPLPDTAAPLLPQR